MKLADISHTMLTAALGLWAGTLLATGAFAAMVFPTVKSLAPTLPSHANFTGEHWLLIAGRVANSSFLIADIAQLILCFVAIAGLIGLFIAKALKPGFASLILLLGMGLTITLLAYHMLVLSPRMATNLKQYWSFAQQGDNTQASSFQQAFSADHPTASTLLTALACLVLIMFITAVLGLFKQPRAAT